MSISVPTAEPRTGAKPPPGPAGRLRLGWLAVVAGVSLAAVMWGGDDQPTAPSSGPVSLPVTELSERVPDVAASSTVDVSRDWSQRFFPGDGSFTGMATSPTGAVAAVGQRQVLGHGAFVWVLASPGEAWTERSLETGDRAVVRDVAAFEDGFVIGGAIVEPGSGTSTPTLWFGRPFGTDFTVRDQPFAGPGRVDGVRIIEGELFVFGQAGGPFSDNLDRGSARFGRVFVSRQREWEDITPPGFSVIVTDLVAADDGLLAVGGDAEGPAVWRREASEGGWQRLFGGGGENGVITDITTHPAGGFVATARFNDDRESVRTVVLHGLDRGRWTTLGSPLRRDVGWIEPVANGVVGGAFDSLGGVSSSGRLWTFDFVSGWDFVEVARVWWEPRWPTTLRGYTHPYVYGSAAGQPAMWQADASSEFAATIPIVIDRRWTLVGQVPASGAIVDTGEHLYALGSTVSPASLWFSTVGSAWREVTLDPGFVLGGVGESADGALVWGQTEVGGVVYDIADDGSRWAVRSLDGYEVRHVSDVGGDRVILADAAEGSVRIDITPDGLVTNEIPRLPPRVASAGDVLVGFDHARPVFGLAVSADLGASWHTIDVPVFTLAESDGGILVVTAEDDRRILALDTASFEISEVHVDRPLSFAAIHGLASVLPTWSGGVVADGPVVVRLRLDTGAEVVDVRPGPHLGLGGVFVATVPGPRGYAVVSERGTPVLYRWNEDVP